MSANRSVAAAQRRRAGPPEPAPPGRGPQPSINSSQMFGNQQRSGASGQNIPSGKLAGQHAAMTQKQMMSQKQQELYQEPQSGLSSINKMTIAQAITLITLRLGKVETQLFSVGSQPTYSMNLENDDNVLVDKNLITSIISRIENLEKTHVASPQINAVGSSQDINILKQQFETIKPLVVQSKNSSAVFKQQIDALKTDLAETKELIAALQNLTMDNNNKIIAFNSIFNSDGSESFIDNNGLNDQLVVDQSQLIVDDSIEEINQNENDGTSFTNLKELIEQELNA